MMDINQVYCILRGAALALAGAVKIQLSAAGCSGTQYRDNTSISDEGNKIVYSDLNYVVVQSAAVHKPCPQQGREYVFIPLTLQNGSDNNIIFSSYVCINAYAVPSGEPCSAAEKDVVSYGKQNIANFRLFDGMIYSHQDTEGWLAFDLPEGSQSVHVDFITGSKGSEILSFDCKL